MRKATMTGTPDSGVKLSVAARRQRAAELKIKGWSLSEIAEELGYGGKNPTAAVANDLRRALEQANKDRNDTVETYRELELARLDRYIREVEAVLSKRHLINKDGVWLQDPDSSEYVEDDSVVLAAIDRLTKLSAERRKFLGLDQPTQVAHSLVNFAIEGVDMEAMK